jgi:hypothetical protein
MAALSGTDQHFTLQQSRTKTVDAIVDDFTGLTRRFSNFAKSMYDEGSSELEQFFPNGLTEYTLCNKSNILLLLSRLATATEAHKTELGERWANDYTQLLESYQNARSAQEEAKGNVAGQRGQRNIQRDELAEQLYINLLTIAINNIDKPEMAKVYFDESILRIHRRKQNGDAAATGIVSGNVTDGATGQAIAGALVTVEGTPLTDTTDEDGDFYIDGIQPGVHSLIFTCTGFTDLQYPGLKIIAGEETEIGTEMIKQ